MKLYAALLANQLVLAQTEALRKSPVTDYQCPHCHKKVVLVNSVDKNAFFKHEVLSHGQGEQQEHRLSKRYLTSALRSAGISAQEEISLASGRLRADIFAAPNIAFEIQCAPLSVFEFEHRHRLYTSQNIKDVWIVGKRHFLRQRLKKTQMMFLRYSSFWGWYLLETHVESKTLLLKFDLKEAPVSSQLSYRCQKFMMNSKGIASLWHFRPNMTACFYASENQQRLYAQRQINQKTQLGIKIAEGLYTNGLTLAQLPSELFTIWRKPGQPVTLLSFLNEQISKKMQ